ncbi:MAG: DUF2442 domain-containing protein [Alloprevotella sp.]|nr:DUF2442 domain-containing protein [Alloprevotella sp.]
MLKVKDAQYIGDYRLLLSFNDGTRKIADLRPYLTGEVFGELLDMGKFVQFGLTGYTIEWANGADLAPEFLHDIGTDAPLGTDVAAEPSATYGKTT